MEDKTESGPADTVEELIRREKEAAERSLENARFDAQLFERIRNAEDARPTVWFVWLRKRGTIVVSSALVLAIAGFLLLQRPSLSRLQQTVQAMSSVLGEAGDGRRMEGRASVAQRIAGAEYTDFGWALKGVLYACKRQSLGNVDLAEALSQVFLAGATHVPHGEDQERTPSLNVGRPKLITGEDFRMFFSGFLKKFEEV